MKLNMKYVAILIAGLSLAQSMHAMFTDKDHIFMAAQKGNLTEIKKCIEQGADIEAINEKGETLLHIAAYYFYCDIAQYLVEQGIDIDALRKDGLTALDIASWSSHAENRDQLKIVQYLTSQGSKLNRMTISGPKPDINIYARRINNWKNSDDMVLDIVDPNSEMSNDSKNHCFAILLNNAYTAELMRIYNILNSNLSSDSLFHKSENEYVYKKNVLLNRAQFGDKPKTIKKLLDQNWNALLTKKDIEHLKGLLKLKLKKSALATPAYTLYALAIAQLDWHFQEQLLFQVHSDKPDFEDVTIAWRQPDVAVSEDGRLS